MRVARSSLECLTSNANSTAPQLPRHDANAQTRRVTGERSTALPVLEARDDPLHAEQRRCACNGSADRTHRNVDCSRYGE
jgi:hypothetical protein